MNDAPLGTPGRLAAALGATVFAASLAYCAYAFAVSFGRPAPPAIAPMQALAINVLLFAVFAAHHSVMARAPIKRRLVQLIPARLERSSYVWVSSGLLMIVCALWQPVGGRLYTAPRSLAWMAYLVQLAGLALIARAAGMVDIWELAGVRQAFGETRTPQFRAVGPYRVVRHPIYLGWALMTLGCPVMTGTRLSFAVISTAYLAIAIPLEERSLVRAFGNSYRSYQSSVRWRMLPGVY